VSRTNLHVAAHGVANSKAAGAHAPAAAAFWGRKACVFWPQATYFLIFCKRSIFYRRSQKLELTDCNYLI
jgi:hypothetical protein